MGESTSKTSNLILRAAGRADLLRRACLVMVAIVLMVAILVLLGWCLGVESFKRIMPGLVAMNPATAIVFVLCAAALWWLGAGSRGARHRLAARAAALIIAAIGAMRLLEYLVGWPPGIDRMLFTASLESLDDPLPNRMAPNTAMNFVFSGTALYLISYRNHLRTAQIIGGGVFITSLLAMIGYLYGVTAFYGVSSFIPMALHTAVCFVLVSFGVLLLRPDQGLMKVVVSDTAGGMLSRRMLPAVVVLPIVLGYLQLLGTRIGIFDVDLGHSLLIAGNVLFFLLLVWGTAWMLYRADTQRKKVEDEIRHARIAAEAANRAKSTFLANMSHEIRTPLTAIVGYADLLFDTHQSNSDRLNCINTIRRNSDHLLAIINDILDISKIEAGEMRLERIACSPSDIVHEVASLMRVRAMDRRLTFEVLFDTPIPRTIRSDPTRLRQVLINLVGNAIKFTERGSVQVRVRMDRGDQHRAPQLCFEVIDTGIGMTPEQITGLFEPFAQADSTTTRRFGGTGLGLSISRRLVEMLRGQISVRSEVGRGTTFSFTIATGPVDDAKMIVPQTLQPEAGDGGAGDDASLAGRILLVDDGFDNRQLLSHFLRSAGADVAMAENGRIACEVALEAMAKDPRGTGYDLILMDMQMPELDGYAATAKLRASGYGGAIIALTAHAMAGDRIKCIQCGCTDYLSKPTTRARLTETVRRYLAGPTTDRPLDPQPTLQPAPAIPSPEESNAGPLRSVALDESIEPFLEQFVAFLPEQVYKLQTLLDQQNLAELDGVIHGLKGTGGLYGFMAITKQASLAEQQIHQQRGLEHIREEVNKLASLIRRVEGYDRRREDPSFAAAQQSSTD